MNKPIKSNCLIACDSGLGHLRRLYIYAESIELTGEAVTILCSYKAYLRFARFHRQNQNIKIIHFETKTNFWEGKKIGECIEWTKNLPCLDAYDTVICDNLPEILLIREDAIISANFFWHEILPSVSEEYRILCRNLLHKYKPNISGCYNFSMPEVTSQVNYKPRNLYVLTEISTVASINLRVNRKPCLLISGGTTQIVKEHLKKIVEKISLNNSMHYSTIYVDSYLYNSKLPKEILIADFSPTMYSMITHAIIRPGLGTVTDLITVGCLILPVYEPANREMSFNHQVVKKFYPQVYLKEITFGNHKIMPGPIILD